MLNLTIILNTNKEINIIIQNSNKQEYDLPLKHPFAFDEVLIREELFLNNYQIEVNCAPFSIKILREETLEIIFDTSEREILLHEKLVKFSTSLPTYDIFGLGERFTGLKLRPDTIYTLWNKDFPADNYDKENINNTYGFHPFYLQREQHNFWHAVLVRTSLGMDAYLDNHQKLHFSKIGGIIDLKFFIDETPEKVLQQYHNYLGGYMVPDFWSMGYHQCRWGYKSSRELEEVLQGFMDNGLPMDSFWLDIDYMQSFKIFTFGNEFQPSSLNKLKERFGKRFIPIVDPAIANQDYLVLNEAKNMDVLLKYNDEQQFLGYQWAGVVQYVDFTHPNADLFWLEMLREFHNQVKFDGIWLDMNEIGQFSIGQYKTGRQYQNGDEDGVTCQAEVKQFPYMLANQRCFSQRTIDIKLVHFDKTTELQMHNFYGYLQVISTKKALREILKTRNPFILSRSNAFGMGRHSAHWTGDNISSFFHLRLSIQQIIRSGIYGIPMVGADICGFKGDTCNELCARWMQLGSLYPFARNHNTFGARPQAPFQLGSDVLKASQLNLKLRYSIIKHYYSLFLQSNGSGTIFKPLFLVFHQDLQTLNERVIQEQFMIGTNLMAVPILYEQENQTEAYYPTEKSWYDFHTGYHIQCKGICNVQNNIDQLVPLYQIGGSIISIQNTVGVKSTEDLNDLFLLQIALNQLHSTLVAQGQIALLSNFQHSNIVNQFCIQSSCICNVNVEVRRSYSQSLLLSLNFIAQNKSNLKQIIQNEYSKITLIKALCLINLSLMDLDQYQIQSQNAKMYEQDYKICIEFYNPIDFLTYDYTSDELKINVSIIHKIDLAQTTMKTQNQKNMDYKIGNITFQTISQTYNQPFDFNNRGIIFQSILFIFVSLFYI